jgi:hypothetical protein
VFIRWRGTGIRACTDNEWEQMIRKIVFAMIMLLGILAPTIPAQAEPDMNAVATAVMHSGSTVKLDPSTGARVQTVYWKSFTWGYIHVGDCSRFNGTWTLYYDDSNRNTWAQWDATVTSSDTNDTWKMYAHYKDANNAELGMLMNQNNPGARNEFTKFMPDNRQQYRWLEYDGYFNPDHFWMINYMSLVNRC